MSTGTYNHTGTVTRRPQSTIPGRSEPSDQVNIRTRRIPIRRTGGHPVRRVNLERRETGTPTWEAAGKSSARPSEFEERLVLNGVDKNLAAQLWQTSTSNTHGIDNDAQSVTLQLVRCLEERGLVTGDIAPGPNGCKIVALVGTSGVGKTTTLAKIASHQACQHKRQVAFISLDDSRIAANAELQIYSRILDIPLKVVSSQAAFQEALRAFQDRDLILVDTPGLMPDQPEFMQVLSILTSTGITIDHYLLLSAATREQELMRIVKQVDLLKPAGFIFTKLDECRVYGHLLNLLLRTQIPVAFETSGNRVPEDITLLNGENLARIILGAKHQGRDTERVGKTHISTGLDEHRAMPDAWHYVANKKTDLYHSPLCESAKRIKAANVEHFKTREAAERERYQPCRLCIPGPAGQDSMPAQYAV